MREHDVVVVGTGTAGQNVVKHCRRAGLSVAVVDRREPGGTCALRGCQPKKFYVVQAGLARLAERLAGHGVATPPAMDWERLEAFKRGFTDPVPDRTEAFFAEAGAAFHRGVARFTGRGTLRVGERELRGRAVVLAVGARPRRPDVPGIDLAGTSDDFLAMRALPRSLTFIGGGFIAFEFAHVAAALGARVTVVNRSARVLRAFDAELADAALAASRDVGIEVLTEQEPTELRRTDAGVEVRCAGGAAPVAEKVFVAAGREAALDDLDLPRIGLEPDPRGLETDARMRVAGRDDLYAVGDCARGPGLAPVADREAVVAAATLAGRDAAMDYTVVPSCCFMQPPLAAVGLTEEQAREQGREHRVSRGDTAGWANQRRRRARHGRYKVLLDADDRILGAHVLGHAAGDLVNLFALAMRAGLPADAVRETMWAYPTPTSDAKYMV